MRQKILFLTTEIPYPLDSGGKIRTYNMLKSISESYDIDLICFSENSCTDNQEEELKLICKSVSIIKKIYTNSKSSGKMFINIVKAILKNAPFVVEKFNDSKYKKKVNELINLNEYKRIIIDHLQVANYLKCLNDNKVILSEHNCEYLILKRRYEKEKNIIKKLFIGTEYIKTRKYEKKICSKVEKVIFLSEEDRRLIIDENYRGTNTSIVPISVETTYVKKNYNKMVNKLLFIGTMSWYPNEQGILWFIENVWHSLLNMNNDLKLYIVGSNPSEEIKKFESNNLIVTGYVDSIDEYIEKCDICIIPLFIGGGMRVKILESMAKGIPCISTSIGAEGIDTSVGEDILIADTKEEFVKEIMRLIDERSLYQKIVNNSTNLIKNNYSTEVIGGKILSLLD